VRAVNKISWKSDVSALRLTAQYAEKFWNGLAKNANKRIQVASPLLAEVTKRGEDGFYYFYFGLGLKICLSWVFGCLLSPSCSTSSLFITVGG
jgi:hypothetical protein